MGRRGVSHHVRGELAARSFQKLGVPCGFLGANERWTSFAPLSEIDGSAAAHALDAAVVQIWSDDDAGANVAFYTPDGWAAELPITLDPDGFSASDHSLLSALARRRIFTRTQSAKLATTLAYPIDRAGWLAGDGLESLLGVPSVTPLPLPCTPELLATLVPTAKLVSPAKRRPKPAAKRPTRKAAVSAATIDRSVLALHTHYWAHIFQMNGWKLYNRYKKHLPAERRRDVDALCNLVVMGAEDDDVSRAVEGILSVIWTDDDWRAAIRDPRLAADEPLSPRELAEWQRLLSADSP